MVYRQRQPLLGIDPSGIQWQTAPPEGMLQVEAQDRRRAEIRSGAGKRSCPPEGGPTIATPVTRSSSTKKGCRTGRARRSG